MAYIGATPTVGNFQVCDAISVVNGQAAYTLQVGGVNVTPESANHMLVSLNGILQKPGSSFTISGSTMTFASNLATGDVIDFVQILGNVLDIGQPSDDTVKTASIQANAVTGAKLNTDIISAQTALTSAPDDTDELLISDAGTLKRIDFSLLKSTPGLNLISTTNITSGTSNVDITSGIDSTYTKYMVSVINLHPSDTGGETLRFAIFTGTGGSQAVDNNSGNYRNSMIGFRNDRTSEINHTNNGADQFLGFSQGIGDQSFNANIFLINPSETTFNKIFHGDFAQVDGSGRIAHGIFGCRYLQTSAVTGIRFSMSSGNIDNAIIKLYGLS